MTHRAALDHVLAVVAASDLGESLVLRGSMTLPAWAGPLARPPGDIDWVVRPLAGPTIDDLSPYPYLERIDDVRHWPEVAHGAGNYRIWDFEDLDTGGAKPRVPEEGLHWIEQPSDDYPLHESVLELLETQPTGPDGLTILPSKAKVDVTWGYEYNSIDGGVRIHLPWQTHDAQGTVQLDFARDETLPDPPVFTAIPRANNAPPTVTWSASRGLSLHWKLTWLTADFERDGIISAKDLYDAVLLAESPNLHLPRRLRQAIPTPNSVRQWPVTWPGPGSAAEWLNRLAHALPNL